MSKSSFFAALAVAAALCACTREQIDNPTTPKNEGITGEEVMVTITASLEDSSDPATRTYLGEDDRTPLWKTGDKFALIATIGGKWAFELKEGNGGGTRSATFTGPDNFSSSIVNRIYYAVYPNDLVGASYLNTKGNQIYFTLPSTQAGSVNDASGQMPSLAYAFRSESNNEATQKPSFENVCFYNMCGLLRIALTSTSAVKVGKLEIIDNNFDALWGTAYIDRLSSLKTNAGPSDWNFTLANEASDKNQLTVNYSPAVSLDSSTPKYFYAAVPPGTLTEGAKVKVYDANNNLIDQFETNGLKIDRSHIKPMSPRPLTYKSLVKNDATANCYIVDSAGLYTFPTKKGNTSTPVGTVASAVVLWESNGTTTAPAVGDIVSSVGYADGHVYFSTTGTPGNALIAAKDEEENILWSWHIWAPSTKITKGQEKTDGPYMMDRNLGALTAVKNDPLSNGFIYQWGRKDPFPGLATYGTNNKFATTASSPNDFRAEETSESSLGVSSTGRGNEAYATAHPTVFLKQYGGDNNKNKTNWMEAPDATLWGSSKQVSDPCPPGYKVAESTAWTGVEAATEEEDDKAVKLGDIHYYPEAKFYYASTGNLHGGENDVQGMYWTATVTNGSSGSWAYKALSSNGTFVVAQTYYSRSAGLSVRCVAE